MCERKTFEVPALQKHWGFGAFNTLQVAASHGFYWSTEYSSLSMVFSHNSNDNGQMKKFKRAKIYHILSVAKAISVFPVTAEAI